MLLDFKNTHNKELTTNTISSEYSTQDTSLASWLYYQGHTIIRVSKNHSRFTTISFTDSQSLQECIKLWITGNAVGNCTLYENARRFIYREIKQASGDR